VGEQDGYRLLATGAAMTAASAVRAGAACMEMWSQRVPPLIKLAGELNDDRAQRGDSDPEADRARLREGLVAVARDSAEIFMHELHRGVEDLDTFTRSEEQSGADGKPRRHRAKP
jgi:hypothetical protein